MVVLDLSSFMRQEVHVEVVNRYRKSYGGSTMRHTVRHTRISRLGIVMIAGLALAAPAATELLFNAGIASANGANASFLEAIGRDRGGVQPLTFERQVTIVGPAGSARCFSSASSAGATSLSVVAMSCI